MLTAAMPTPKVTPRKSLPANENRIGRRNRGHLSPRALFLLRSPLRAKGLLHRNRNCRNDVSDDALGIPPYMGGIRGSPEPDSMA